MEKIDENLVTLIPTGADNRITSGELSKSSGLRGTQIRRIINRKRADFVPICSDSYGYFIAETADEIDHTIAQLNSRIHNMIVAREGLKKAQRLMRENDNV